MDFYITKYQRKMMESMTPLFQSMLGGMQRLEQQEREEQEEEARKLLNEEVVLPLRRRTQGTWRHKRGASASAWPRWRTVVSGSLRPRWLCTF